MLAGSHTRERTWFAAATAGFFLLVFLPLLSLNMQRGFDHDEHMYVAAGKLLASKSLLPYKDYHYLHMPNLVLAYGLVFKLTDYTLLAARAFSVLCAWLSLALVFSLAVKAFAGHRYLLRFLIGAGSVVLVMTNPIFTFTSGRAWNHDLMVLLGLAAVAVHAQGARRERPNRWVFVSGVLLGLAIGTRLSFAPAVVPFLVAMLLYPRVLGRHGRLALVCWFGGGILVSLLPALALFALAPKQFLFDNIGYAHFNTMYRQVTGHRRAMTPLGKLLYLTEVIGEPGNLLLLLSVICCVSSVEFARVRAAAARYSDAMFLVMLVPFLLIGAFGPTPTWYQYLYAPLPFAVLAILHMVAAFGHHEKTMPWGLRLGVPIALLSAVSGMPSPGSLAGLLVPREWFPSKTHRLGVEMKAAVGEGRVLTLAPIYPLEGGANIYEEFAAGPFVWRIAPLVPEKTRRELGIVAEPDLPELLRRKPPRAVFVGFEGDLEEPFVHYAKAGGAGSGVLILSAAGEAPPEWGGVPPLLEETKPLP